MRYADLIVEGRDAPLWHAYGKPWHAVRALKTNEMLGTTTQRWWPDDRHYYDDEGDVYKNSYWMKGISMTRDPEFAKRWGVVLFCLDQNRIAQRYKIIPLAWNKTIRGAHHKKEREEFVVLEREPETYRRYDPDHDEERFDQDAFGAPAKKTLKPLDQFLLGIWLNEMIRGWYEDDEAFLTKHPKFRGWYTASNKPLWPGDRPRRK